MSDVPQMGPGGNPFGFDLSEIMRMLQSQGPVNLDAARQVASAIATTDPETGQPRLETPVDAATTQAFDDVVRAAQLAVADATGLSAALTVTASCVDRQAWAQATLDALAPVLEALARAMQGPTLPQPDGADVGLGAEGDGGEALFGFLMQSLLPVLLGVWSGWMIGQLAHRALGQYDLPLPLDEKVPALRFVTRNVDDFAREWELPADETRYALALREVVHAAQRTVPWVRARLLRLASDYVAAYEVRPDAFEEQLGHLDFSDPASMESLGQIGDPGALLGAMQSERQGPMLEELQRYVSVLEGYADVVVDQLGQRAVSAHTRIDEALRRHRLDRGDATAFVDRLLGLELDRNHYDEGVAFCRGVVERAGLEALNRLWEGEHMIPTRPELEAPGLWLARIELPDATE